ncbi:MAG: hypothetical protein ABH868_02705 [bacterium]
MSIKKKDIVYIFVIIGLVLIFFAPVIFDTMSYYYRDIYRYYFPVKSLAAESVQQGELPFWNPYNYCGIPFLATLQHGLFYPLSLLCYILPFNLGFKYFFVIHFLLGGIFMYLLCRSLKLGGFSSFISTTLFIFSGYLISTINLLTTLSAVIWLPLILLFFKKATEQQKLWPGLFIGILLSFQFLAGQPDVVFMGGILLILFALYQAGILFTEKKNLSIQQRWSFLSRTGLVLLLSFLFFFLLSAIQSIAFKELISLSSRTIGTDFERVTFWSLHPLELIVLLLPAFSRILLAGSESWFGQIWLRNFYVGILALILILFTARSSKRQYLRFFWLLGAVSLILTLGKYTPIYQMLFAFIPGFDLIRYPVKFMALLVFSFSVLAGFGMQQFLGELKNGKDMRSLIKIIFTFFIVISAGFVLLYFKQERVSEIFAASFLKEALPQELVMLKARFPRVVRDYFLMLLFLGANLVIFSLAIRSKIRMTTFKYFYAAAFLASLAIVGYNIEPLVHDKFYNEKDENQLFIQENSQDYGRFYLTPRSEGEVTHTVVFLNYTYYDALLDRRAVVLPNANLPVHLFSAGGYGSIRLRRYTNFMGLVKSQASPMEAPIINLLNIEHLISLWEIDSKQFRLVRSDHANIYKNTKRLPRAFIVPEAVLISKEPEIAKALGDKNFDPTQKVIIEQPHASLENIRKGKISGDVELINYDRNKADFTAKLDNPGWMLFADTYYPGWRVYIDGVEGEIFVGDYLFRAVYLEPGEHKVSFVYEPTAFSWAILLSLVAVLSVFVAGFYTVSIRSVNKA